MIEVKIPAEIQEYKSKLIAGLSTRQVIAVGGALLIGVPVAVLGNGHISSDILPWLVIALVVPFAGFGFFTFKGMRFEEFVKVFFMMNFFPQRRVYEDTDVNLFSSLNEEIQTLDIIQQKIDIGEYDEYEAEEWRGIN